MIKILGMVIMTKECWEKRLRQAGMRGIESGKKIGMKIGWDAAAGKKPLTNPAEVV